jgi:hypothetical protein
VSALIEGRYTLGLSDLDDSGGSDSAVKNRAIAVYAGVSFGVGG